MDMKIGLKEKPKFAPPSAREKQPQGNETSKSKNEETTTTKKIHTDVDEKITSIPTAGKKNVLTLEQKSGFIKAKHVSDKCKLLVGLSEKGEEEENKAEKKKVNIITDGGRAGSMENSITSESLSDDRPEREVIEKKARKEKVKNKQREQGTGEDKDADEVTKKNGKKLNTGEVDSVQKRRKKTECKPKVKEEQEHKEKPSVALTDSQYEDLFDSVLGAAQLETCMEDARAMLSEVELLQASIDQEVSKMREQEEEIEDICQESEEDEQEIQEDRRKETHHRHKDEKAVKIGSRKRRRVDEDHDSETDEYDSWVQCSRAECKKWRRLQDDTDPSTLPKNWTCGENADPARSRCDAPEEGFSGSKEEEFYYCSLVPGSLVWAQQTGYPWWPAMIERDPVTSDFLLFKTRKDPFPLKCHVTYFGSPVSRAWIQRCRVRDYNDLPEQTALNMVRQPVYKRKLKDAIKMAGQAQKLPLQKRLSRFGFMTRRATVEEKLEEDSDIEEILALIGESSGKGNETRKRAKGSGIEEVRRPQKQRKNIKGRVKEAHNEVNVIKKAAIPSGGGSGAQTSGDVGKMGNEEKKPKEGDIEEKGETEKPRKEADQSRAMERKETTKVAGKKTMKKPEKERMDKGKKGIEKKKKQKQEADLQGTKAIQTALKKQDGPTESQEGAVIDQERCSLTESDDQAVPESAVETSLEVVEEEEKEPEMQRDDEPEQMQKELDGGQKTEGATPVGVAESVREVRDEEQKEEEEEEEEEESAKGEGVVSKDEEEQGQEPEQCVVEGLGLSDEEGHFLDTELDIMACRDDLMKRLCAEEEEEEEELSVLFEE